MAEVRALLGFSQGKELEDTLLEVRDVQQFRL